MNKLRRERAIERKPVEKEIHKLAKRFGKERTLRAISHYTQVVRAENRAEKQIAELEKELARLRK